VSGCSATGLGGRCEGRHHDAVLRRFSEVVANPLPWREVTSAPVQEVVHEDVDLVACCDSDAQRARQRPYISAGLLIARNPRTGVQNVAIHRCR